MQNERVAYTACPLCESAVLRDFATVNCTAHGRWREPLEPVINWVQCEACGHIFTHGHFTDEALGILFQSTNTEQIVGRDIEFQRGVSAKMVQRVVEAIGLPDDRLWLDVGFGNGSLLMTALEFGFTVFGVDLRRQNVDDIRSFGIPAYHGTLGSALEHVPFEAKPTVISLADVVEHEPFPVASLRSARTLIADDGMLLISMPNRGSPLWNFWNANDVNPYWIEIEHYHNFTRKRLYEILKQVGFQPIHYAISERYRGCMEILARAV